MPALPHTRQIYFQFTVKPFVSAQVFGPKTQFTV